MTYTTISIFPKTKKELDAIKVHPNQSYDEVINKLLKRSKLLKRLLMVRK